MKACTLTCSPCNCYIQEIFSLRLCKVKYFDKVQECVFAEIKDIGLKLQKHDAKTRPSVPYAKPLPSSLASRRHCHGVDHKQAGKFITVGQDGALPGVVPQCYLL